MICTSVCVVSESIAQEESEDFASWLGTAIPQLQADFSVPGAAVAVWRNGDLVLKQTFGDARDGQAVSDQTVFNAGAIAKTLTAWAALKLVEDGQLDLDAPIEQYLSRWTMPASSFGTAGVTMRRILSHTSGLGLETYVGFDSAETVPSLEESLAGATNGEGDVRVMYPPGSKWQYSGGGYAVAQLVIEEVSGTTFQQYARQSLLEPLGMTDTSFDFPDQAKQVALPHGTLGEEMGYRFFAAPASASLYTSIEDMVKFVGANIGVTGVALGGGVLTPSSLILTQTAHRESGDQYGLGYSVRYLQNGKSVVGHGGSVDGWQANIAMVPALGDAIVILTNGSNGDNLSTAVRCKWYEIVDTAPPASACLMSIGARLASTYNESGIDAALSLYDTIKASPEGGYYFDEYELNGFGYDLLALDKREDALLVFRKNVSEYPSASNPYDSLGEMYYILGDLAQARQNYRKSLELDPSNTNAAEMLQKMGSM